MTTTDHYTLPRRPRLNLRIVAFVAIVAMPFVWMIYTFVNAQLSRGVHVRNGVAEVDLKALGSFQFDPNNGSLNDIPPQWRALDGKKVALEGFMWDSRGASDKVKQFQFVYNIQKCCFNGPPLVQERVFARVPDGKAIPYVNDLARVIGTLHVAVHKDPEDGAIKAVYTMDVEQAEPLG